MKQLIGFAMMLASGNLGAQTLVCKAQVPSTGCGSGVVSVKLDLEANTYESVVGAVACWGTDVHSKGMVAQRASSPYPHTGSTVYVLAETGGAQPFGKLIVQEVFGRNAPAVIPAFFDVSSSYLDHFGPLIRHQFNLECERHLEPTAPSPDRKGDYHCSIGFCGGW